MIYLALAIMTLLFQCLESFNEIKISKKYFRWSFLLIICTISGLRFNVGTDYQHYNVVYNLLLNGEASYVEVGFKILNFPFFIFGESGFYVLIFVVSTFILMSIDFFIKQFIDNRYYFLAWFFVLASGMVFSSYNAVRQYIAIAIFIFSIQSILKKRIYHYIFYTLLACLFHSSAIVLIMMLPVFFIEKKHSKKVDTLYVVLYGLSILFLVVDFRELLKLVWFIVPQRWNWYIVSDFFNSRNYGAVVKQLMPNILLIYMMISVKNEAIESSLSKKLNFETVSYYGFILFVSLSNIFYGIMVLQRFVLYFEIFMIPVIISIAMKNYIIILGRRVRSEWIMLAMIAYFFVFLLYLIFVRNAHDIIPYRTIIEVLL